MSETNKARPSVDSESFALAQHFLRDDALLSDDNLWELAGDIQECVESWFQHKQWIAQSRDEAKAEDEGERNRGN